MVKLTKHRHAVRLSVPSEHNDRLGAARIVPAIVTINDQPVRTSLHKIDGCYMMAVNRQVQQQIGVTAGDTVRVTVEPDLGERAIDVPDDLAAALAEADLAATFDGLTAFRQNQVLESVTGAKRAETRARRIQAAVLGLQQAV